MTAIQFVVDMCVDTNIPFVDYAYNFEKDAIVRLDNGKIGRVLQVNKYMLDVLYRVNLNCWKIEHWPKEHCERRNYATSWYHDNPFDSKKKFYSVKTADKMEVDEYVIPFIR